MIRGARRLTVLSVAVMTAAACGDSVAAPDAGPARLHVTPFHAVLDTLGAEMSFVAVVYDAQERPMPDARVSWSSSDEAVATVTGDGTVAATGAGSATISATAQGVQGSASLDVALDVIPPELRALSANKSRVDVSGGASLVTITAELSDEGSGVTLAVAQFESPLGFPITGLVTLIRVAGAATNGTYQGVLTLSPSSSTGTWSLAVMRADDARGNASTWRRLDLLALNMDVSFEVVGPGE